MLIVFVIFSIIKSISPKILTVFLVAQITIVVSGSVRVMPKKNTNISNTYCGKYITCIWDTLVLIVFTCFSGEWISLYKKYVAIISECNTYINLVDCNL